MTSAISFEEGDHERKCLVIHIEWNINKQTCLKVGNLSQWPVMGEVTTALLTDYTLLKTYEWLLDWLSLVGGEWTLQRMCNYT